MKSQFISEKSKVAVVAAFHILVLLGAALGNTAWPEDQTNELDILRRLHARAVQELERGAEKDTDVPEDVQRLLEHTTGVHVKGGGNGYSWVDVLRETELGFKKHSLKVTISVNSQPDGCLVSYTPFVGGNVLDGGWTPVRFTANPKYYEIACHCGADTLRLYIDAMADREVQFQCQELNPRTKN